MTFAVKQEKFEGPLALLLELIEKEKLSITEISLAKVTDDYVAHVKKLEKIDPEQLAEFLVIAAQLMLIKSRSLLPDLKLSEEDEASIEELEKRLEEYKKMRELAKGLKVVEAAGKQIMSRESFMGLEPVFYPPPKLTPDLFKAAFTEFMAALPKFEKLAEDKIKRIISLEEKVKEIQRFLQTQIEQAFSDIVKGAKEKVEVIVSFLAILELAKQKFVALEQKKMFDDIFIKKI
ncbi:MAG: segregation/condensation protein A [Candidatus Sungbacteria bacterium]|nr:segregation/condensation protein A [Candidatus Sungbacteria bacterium]